MHISFLLNEKPVEINTAPNRGLVDILREDFSLLGTRAGCYAGHCGTCSIFYNGQLAYSCMIAAFSTQDASILTVEGLADQPLYQDIMTGLGVAKYRPCDICIQSKLLSLYALFEENPVPDRFALEKALLGKYCRCVDTGSIMNAISIIIDAMRSRRDAHNAL